MERYIEINGEQVPVSEEVYRAYKRPAWRESKRRKARRAKERSLQKFIDDGYDIESADPLVDEIVADKLLLEMLMDALDELTVEERGLIDAVYYEGNTVREFATKTGKSKSAVQRAKEKIIEKLQNYLS